MDALFLFHTQDASGNPLPGCQLDATSPNGDWHAITNPCGDFAPTLTMGEYTLTISKPGYTSRTIPMSFATPPDAPILIGLETDNQWSNKRLRRILGAIWPTRGPMPFGPRPGQPDNIIDTGCEAYGPGDLATANMIITSRKYTHVQMGPFIDPGYHGQYPPVDFRNNPDQILADVEGWWNAGKAVVAFIGPDGWSTDQMRELEPIFLQPRWQAAMKQIVPMGWEPSEATPNSEFVARFAWAKRIFPNALQYIHLPADFDAPGNNDDFTPGQPKYIGHAKAWANVVPYLTGFLIQNGPYTTSPSVDPQLAKNFGDQFRAVNTGTLRDRFLNGYAGWPMFSANPNDESLDLIAAEQTSYEAYWKNLPEVVSQAWGKVAMDAGADGAFDGVAL